MNIIKTEWLGDGVERRMIFTKGILCHQQPQDKTLYITQFTQTKVNDGISSLISERLK